MDQPFITELDNEDQDYENENKLWSSGTTYNIPKPKEIKEYAYSKLAKNKILGRCSYKKFGFTYNYYFGLDLKQSRINMFKKDTNKKPKTYYKLFSGRYLTHEELKNEEVNRYQLFIKSKKGRTFRMNLKPEVDIEKVKDYLDQCFQIKPSKSFGKNWFALLGQNVILIDNIMFKLSSGVYVNFVSKQKKVNVNKTKSNIFFCDTNILKGIIAGISGIFQEPFKNRKERTVDPLGLGIAGLIYKPFLQSVDMVTMIKNNGNPTLMVIPNIFVIKTTKIQQRKMSKRQRNDKQEIYDLYEKNKLQDSQLTFLLDYQESKFVKQTLYLNTGVVKQHNLDINYLKQQTKHKFDYRMVQVEDQFKDSVFEKERENIYKMIQTYEKKAEQNQFYTEEKCEFLILHPIVDNLLDGQFETLEICENSYFDDKENILCSISEDKDSKEENIYAEEYEYKGNNLNIQAPKNMNFVQPSKNLTTNIDVPVFQHNTMKTRKRQLTLMKFEEDNLYNQDFHSSSNQIVYSDVEEIPTESDDSDNEDSLAFQNVKDKYEFIKISAKNVEKLLKNFKYSDKKDENRVWEAHAKGGKENKNKLQIALTRSVGKYIISQIGRKILSGDFNLTTVSFPIKANCPKSGTETIFFGSCQFPLYMNLAAATDNYLERFKLLIVATFANYPIANTFMKPLNPILGETLQGSYIDGTKCYSEQISHHPPETFYLVIGRNEGYKAWGTYDFEVNASINSLKIHNGGYRKVQFKDGQTIRYDFGYEQYGGTFVGEATHQTLGQVVFEDVQNKIKAVIKFNSIKNRPSDYMSGAISVNGEEKSQLYGSYLGFLEFDGNRYWDHRQNLPFKIQLQERKKCLKSDHQYRLDKTYMESGKMSKAQRGKLKQEQVQRRDAKLRKEFKAKKKSNQFANK